MKSLGFIGKLIFVLPMVYFGFGHLGNANQMTEMVPGFLPMGVLWVYLTGMGLILASIAIIIDKKARLAAQLLGLMLLLFATMIHLPNLMNGTDPVSFFKDLSLAGAAWFLSAHVKD